MKPNDPILTECGSGRRHAAGENPAKRDQILDGAQQVFMKMGFDAASMNDISKAAGVSKGTIYVYFADKVELFEAIVLRERERVFGGMQAILEGGAPIGEKLGTFARNLGHILCSKKVIRAQRIVIGTVEKMPELGSRFYESGAYRTQVQLREFFAAETAAGRLRIENPDLAAMQFVDLATGPLWRARLFTASFGPPSEEEVDLVADSAVRMFMAAYGPD